MADERSSSQPDFWDVRYEREDYLFGTAPNAFVKEQAHRLSPNSTVVELGAGEARTLAWLAREKGHRTTAVDFSGEALTTAQRWARMHDLALETIEADVRRWTPDRIWDAAIVTFLQLLPHERPALYRLLRRSVRPGGWIFAEWFRPQHLDGPFDRMGPSRRDRMVPVDEVRRAFEDDNVLQCEPSEVRLDEGEKLSGRAAVVRMVARRRGPGATS